MKLTGRTSLWLAWLGFNFSHGLGLVAFGLSLLLVSLAAPRLPFTSTWLSPLSVAVSSVYFLLAIRYWFYVPALGAGLGAACFAVAWVLG
ncbi:MAG: hypothetical protein HYZ72_13845 [Deltaproteobacteria bacterium]|nr:hypothetical protein [Deltaproteobacteria bacterium]